MRLHLRARRAAVSLTFRIAKVRDVWPQLLPLAHDHWCETENYRHDQPFSPDLERYAYYEEIGFYILYTAWDGDKLVGNLGMYYVESMHTQQLIATEDTLFLLPEYRHGRNAIRLIDFMVQDMKGRGVVEISCTAKDDRVGRLLGRLAFRPVARQYSLRVAPTARMATAANPVGDSHDATSRHLPDVSPAAAGEAAGVDGIRC